jgi:hypothetical protein
VITGREGGLALGQCAACGDTLAPYRQELVAVVVCCAEGCWSDIGGCCVILEDSREGCSDTAFLQETQGGAVHTLRTPPWTWAWNFAQ